MTPDEMALEAWPIGSRVIVYEDGIRQSAVYEVIGAYRGDLRLRHVDNGTTFCTHPRNVADAASCDARELAAIISGYTGEATVTDEEASAVLAWCREWVADCGFDNVEDVSTLPDAVLLAGCNRHVDGGLAFVLADVRACADLPFAASHVGSGMEVREHEEVYEVRDRNARDSRDVLAGPFLSREQAEEEKARWCAPVDAYIVPCTVDGDRYARIVAHWEREALRERADALGYEAGVAAGSWVIDGNTDAEDAASLLRMIEDGDPAAWDAFPSSPLSGEYADGWTEEAVCEQSGLPEETWNAYTCAVGFEQKLDYEAVALVDDVLRAFEDGYSRGVMDEIVRSCRALLPDADEEETVRELSEGAVSVLGFPAVALRVVGSAGSGMVRVVMVGDDHEHVVPLEDVTPLDDLAYCAECGQLGCEHDGRERVALKCPECGEEVWDVPNGSKLAKCWNTEGHADGGTLAFDTMDEDETDYDVPEVVYVACSCCGHVVTADAERMPRDCENCYAASLRTFAELDDAEAYSEHVLGDGRA